MGRGPRLLIALAVVLGLAAVIGFFALRPRYRARPDGAAPTRVLTGKLLSIGGDLTLVGRDDGTVWIFGLYDPPRPTHSGAPEGTPTWAPTDSIPVGGATKIVRLLRGWGFRADGTAFELTTGRAEPSGANDVIAITSWCAAHGSGAVLCSREIPVLRGARKLAELGKDICGLIDGKLRCFRIGNEQGETSPPDREDLLDLAGNMYELYTLRTNGEVHFYSVHHKEGPVPLQHHRVEGLPPLVQLEVGLWSACGRSSDGHAYCWGSNKDGQLGDGTFESRLTGALVQSLPPIRDIKVGSHHACALAVNDEVWCWGRGEAGQLGDGKRDNQPLPVRALW